MPRYSSTQERLIANSMLSKESSYEGTACWEWIGARNIDGYGHISFYQKGKSCKKKLAHRVSFEEFNGPIPAGHVIMHQCNNKVCIAPLHLKSGTQSENIKQCVADGRHVSQQVNQEDEEYFSL